MSDQIENTKRPKPGEDESEIIENSESWIKSALKFYDFEIKNTL